MGRESGESREGARGGCGGGEGEGSEKGEEGSGNDVFGGRSVEDSGQERKCKLELCGKAWVFRLLVVTSQEAVRGGGGRGG
mmetsp:Transcript_45851/g.110347  ORF Transcript_45851/g.110347 Transcript_45851/m.110347 type:complete len:81 (+) Transcript_45851:825-1067(+)